MTENFNSRDWIEARKDAEKYEDRFAQEEYDFWENRESHGIAW